VAQPETDPATENRGVLRVRSFATDICVKVEPSEVFAGEDAGVSTQQQTEREEQERPTGHQIDLDGFEFSVAPPGALAVAEELPTTRSPSTVPATAPRPIPAFPHLPVVSAVVDADKVRKTNPSLNLGLWILR
jgi:hypothetical protein